MAKSAGGNSRVPARRRVLLLVAALALSGCGSTKTELPPQTSLAAPSGLRVESSASSVQLSWNAVAGASSYRVYWARGSTVTRETGTASRSLTTTFLHSGLRGGETYAYLVAAVDEKGHEGRPSAVVTTTLGATPVDAPQNVRAIAGDAQVTIDWDPIPAASGYQIEVTSRPATFTVTNHPAPPFVHQRALNRTTYSYRVRATFGGDLGPPSLPVEATPMPTQPGIPVFTNVQVGTVAGFAASGGVARHGVISLSWTAADHAKHYQVYAKRGQGPEVSLIPEDQPLTSTTFVHNLDVVDYETVYEYRVEAFNDGVASGMSNPPTPPVRASVPRPLENGAPPYYYVVRTADSAGEATSNEASAIALENVILTPPTAVSVSDTPRDSGKSLTITWSPSTTLGVKGQRLYRSESAAPGTYTSIQTFSGNTTSLFADTTVDDGKQYFYALTALAGDLESDLSATVSAIASSNSDLVPPSELTVSDTPDDAGDSLTITWVLSTTLGVTSQRLYRSTTDGGPYVLRTVSDNPLLSEFVDRPVSTGISYYYTVRALIDDQESAPSNQAAAIANVDPQPFPPRSLKATDSPADFGGAIDLSWSPSVSDTATEHRLYRSTSSGGPYQLVAVFNDKFNPRYTDSGVPSGPSATGLAVVPEGGGLLITWSPVARAGDGYRLYWWEKNSLGVIQSSGTEVDIVTERFVHRGLTSGSRYAYAVQVQGFPAVSYPVEAPAP